MKQAPEHIIRLWERYLSDKATLNEVDDLYGYLKDQSQDEQQHLYAQIAAARLPSGDISPIQVPEWVLQQILREGRESIIKQNEAASGSNPKSASSDTYSETGAQIAPVRRLHFLFRWQAVASIIFLLVIGAYWWFAKQQPSFVKQGSTGVREIADRAPAKEGAVLTLDNGTIISLDSLGNGWGTQQQATTLLLNNGRLVYNAGAVHGEGGQSTYNTISTPRGRQFQVELPDGSLVWMNSASTLRFPVSFSGNERAVDITGEAYFEVTKNQKMPFVVNVSGKASVEVLGTSFNINAHGIAENISTTLLSGSVKMSVKGADRAVVIKPGQQAVVRKLLQVIEVNTVDTDKIMAWKNGLFDFEGVPLKEAMRELERWYDIEVVYEGKVPDILFFGEMERSLNLSEVLKALQEAKLHFRWEGERRLVVIP